MVFSSYVAYLIIFQSCDGEGSYCLGDVSCVFLWQSESLGHWSIMCRTSDKTPNMTPSHVTLYGHRTNQSCFPCSKPQVLNEKKGRNKYYFIVFRPTWSQIYLTKSRLSRLKENYPSLSGIDKANAKVYASELFNKQRLLRGFRPMRH